MEYLVAAYFQSQGYFVRRGINLRVAERGQDATDVDVFAIRFDPPFVPFKVICDCKDHRNVKITERFYWTRGLADFLEIEVAYVAVPYASPDQITFARRGGVTALSRQIVQSAIESVTQSGYLPFCGLTDSSIYLAVEARINAIGKLDRRAKDAHDDARRLLLVGNPYVAVNQCMALLGEATEKLRLGSALPNQIAEAWRYIGADLVAILAVLILRIASETFVLSAEVRSSSIVKALTYGDMAPVKAEAIFKLATEVAKQAVLATSGKVASDLNLGGLRPPSYADSFAGLVERAIKNPGLYGELPLVLDHLLFAHAFPFGAFRSELFRRQFPGRGEDHLKSARNVLAFVRDFAGFETSFVWHQQDLMPRLTPDPLDSERRAATIDSAPGTNLDTSARQDTARPAKSKRSEVPPGESVLFQDITDEAR